MTHFKTHHNININSKDEYGRTCLGICIWKLNPLNITKYEVKRILILCHYGASPFIRYQKVTILQKLKKILDIYNHNFMTKNIRTKSRKIHNVLIKKYKYIQNLQKLYNHFYLMEQYIICINTELNRLAKQGIILDIMVDIINEYLGLNKYMLVR